MDLTTEKVALTERLILARVRIAAQLTVDNVRAECGDRVADLVESSLEAHLGAAFNDPRSTPSGSSGSEGER